MLPAIRVAAVLLKAIFPQPSSLSTCFLAPSTTVAVSFTRPSVLHVLHSFVLPQREERSTRTARISRQTCRYIYFPKGKARQSVRSVLAVSLRQSCGNVTRGMTRESLQVADNSIINFELIFFSQRFVTRHIYFIFNV